MTMTDPSTWGRESQAKVAADGLMLESISAAPVQEFSAAKASAVTGDANTRLTTGEEADAEPLIKRRG
jgi:hypothetical protein